MADDPLFGSIESLAAQNAAKAATAVREAEAAAGASPPVKRATLSAVLKNDVLDGGGGGVGGDADGGSGGSGGRNNTMARAVGGAAPITRKRSLSKDGSPLKRLRSASEALRANNPFKKFARGGRLPFIDKRFINDGTGQVRTYLDPITQRPVPFAKSSQKKLSEFREYQTNATKMVIPTFLHENAVRFELKIGDHTLLIKEVLGSGGFGLVFKATIVETAMDVAVKFLLTRKNRQYASSAEFIKARSLPQKLFESDTIVHYLALCERAPYNNSFAELIIMELADGGDLNQAIVKPGDDMELTPLVMTAKHARLITIQIIRGLANLRKHEYLHRDLKPENLWFHRDGRLVLGDLGCIKDLEGKSSSREQTLAGTEMADAPELSHARANHRGGRGVYDSEKTDVWAVGFIYFQLRSGLHLRETEVLKIKGREKEYFTPATATTRANDKFWKKWEHWQKNIQPGGKYAKAEWTQAYRTEPFGEDERAFLDEVIALDPNNRPTIADLMCAVENGRGANPALRWLSPKFGSSDKEEMAAFEEEMQKRVTNFAAGRNIITYPYEAAAATSGTVTHQEVMRQTHDHLARKVEAAAVKLKYHLTETQLADTPVVIQTIFDFTHLPPGSASSSPPSLMSPANSLTLGAPAAATAAGSLLVMRDTGNGNGNAAAGSPLMSPTTPSSANSEPVLRVIVEVEQPNDELKGTFSFERRKGDNHVFKSFMRRLKREFAKP